MQEIKCPKCGEVFQVDQTGYDQIARQVRDQEFSKELERRTRELEDKRARELELIRLQEEKEHTESLTQKDAEISLKDRQIADLQAQLNASETAKNLAVSQALEKKNVELTHEVKLHSEQLNQKIAEISERDQIISELKAQLNSSDTVRKLAVEEAVKTKEAEISQKVIEIASLKGELLNKDAENQLKEKSIQEKYESQLKLKDEQIEYYKDFKLRLSTKMIGESLEQHCLNQFNTLRMSAFPNAYFEKDNDASSGSKGDFIFRECAEDGTELISIMFEMKNESDTTATKHKNEDFFKELDKDRQEKNCEYAILVSLLEQDNELYNNGIVDVSYRYPKMYVIRPQFFISIISLLRNAAQNALKYRRELRQIQLQQIDISNFEKNMTSFKDGFNRNYRLAGEKFAKAIDEIDKSIDHLQKTKDALLSSERQLRLANSKIDDLSIKKLTKDSPSIKALFDAQKEEN